MVSFIKILRTKRRVTYQLYITCLFYIKCMNIISGDMVQWLTHRPSNLRMGSGPGAILSGPSRCFLEQENLHSLLSTVGSKVFL